MSAPEALDWVGLLLCGRPRRHWSNRRLLLLKVYADDSGSNSPPVSVLAGWIGSPEQWLAFGKDWDDILRMSPRIEYFKLTEAMNFNGQFAGISAAGRDEKLKLLVNVLIQHRLIGAAAIVPHEVFHRHFGRTGSSALKVPYPLLFVRLMARIQRHYLSLGGDVPKIDFIFDQQVEQEQEALIGWYDFRKNAPAEVQPVIGNPPYFLDDRDVVGLQAADLMAGWMRIQHAALFTGGPIPKAIWGDRGNEIEVLTWTLSDEVAQDIKVRLATSAP
jgi:hypothetical protein